MPGCFPREFPQGFKCCGVLGSEELPALHLQPGGSRAVLRAGPTWQLITAEFILTDALPEEQQQDRAVSAPEGDLQHFILGEL